MLKRMPAALKVGLCFDFQLVETLPVEPHDVPVDRVVTDRRTSVCASVDAVEESSD